MPLSADGSEASTQWSRASEHSSRVLEALRQPMEDKAGAISRTQGSVTLPANFQLVTGQQSCSCGINHKELLIVKVWELEEWGEGELL